LVLLRVQLEPYLVILKVTIFLGIRLAS